jgi:hypothetical protein
MTQFTATVGVQFTPPSAPVNSGVSSFASQGNYDAQNIGTVKIPSTMTPPTTYSIPFGLVGSAMMVIIENKMSASIGIKLNGSQTVNFDLAPSAVFMMSGSTVSSGVPLTAASFTVAAAPSTTEYCNYFVFGS